MSASYIRASGHLPVSVAGFFQAERGVIVGQAALFYLRRRRAGCEAGVVTAEPGRRGAVFRVGHGLVPRPHPLMVGEQATLTAHLHPRQVGAGAGELLSLIHISEPT